MATINHYVIEVGECGLVRTLHEPIEGPVISGDRGSKKYVCGEGVNPYPWPTDPFDTKTFGKPELFVEHSPLMGIVVQQTQSQSQQQSQWQAASSYSSVGDTFIDFDHITVHCGCKPAPPDDVPVVPVTGSGILLASAVVISFMLKRA